MTEPNEQAPDPVEQDEDETAAVDVPDDAPELDPTFEPEHGLAPDTGEDA